MGHHISAYIARLDAIKTVAAKLGEAKVYMLDQPPFCIVPVHGKAYRPGADVIEGYWRFNEKLRELGRACSSAGLIAYVETDYFGGEGTQGATVWNEGKEIYPPTIGEWPINTALRMIGVQRTGEYDEFDSVGLGQLRDMGDFEDLPPL